MPPQPGEYWFDAEQTGDTTIVRFTRGMNCFLDDNSIKRIGEYLCALITEEGQRRLVLNLATVERMDSLLLGKLVALHKKALAQGGRLVLCCLQPKLYEVFQTLQLTGFMKISATEQDALLSP